MSEEKKLVIVRVGKPIEVAVLPPSQDSWIEMQSNVGGDLEPIRVDYEGTLMRGYVNEDGLRLNLPFNPVASKMCNRGIVGTLVIPLWKEE